MLFVTILPSSIFIVYAEDFLSPVHENATDALLVECWIGKRGIEAAGSLYLSNNYSFIVLVGGLQESKWGEKTWNHTDYSKELLQNAFPEIEENRIMKVTTDIVTKNRTYASARSVEATITTPSALTFRRNSEIQVQNITIFTEGAHARRSTLVYERVFPNETEVFGYAWKPDQLYQGPWYQSSYRAKNLATELIGYFYELIFYSGRWY